MAVILSRPQCIKMSTSTPRVCPPILGAEVGRGWRPWKCVYKRTPRRLWRLSRPKPSTRTWSTMHGINVTRTTRGSGSDYSEIKVRTTGPCSKGYPSETPLKPKSLEISFVSNILSAVQLFWYLSTTVSLPCSVQSSLRLDRICYRQTWVQDIWV